MVRRTLYECLHAKVKIDRIYCAKMYPLSSVNIDRTLIITKLIRGEPLSLTICQECKDFSSMGDPVLKEDKGWAYLL